MIRPTRASYYTLCITLALMGSACTQSNPQRVSSHVDPTDAPSSQPSSRSSAPVKAPSSGFSLEANAQDVVKWGGARFNSPLVPQELHQISSNLGVAVFAGGCFWCMEAPFERKRGVVAVYSGYTGGSRAQPTYAQVSASRTQHLEAVLIYYHPDEVTYAELLDVFWRNINPTQVGGQFADKGTQYETAIFTVDATQAEIARESKNTLARSGKFKEPIAVQLREASVFWPAEDYHQDYYKTHSAHYKRYKYGSGRAGYLKRVWGVSE